MPQTLRETLTEAVIFACYATAAWVGVMAVLIMLLTTL